MTWDTKASNTNSVDSAPARKCVVLLGFTEHTE